MHEGEKINKRLCKFFIEIFEFTDERKRQIASTLTFLGGCLAATNI